MKEAQLVVRVDHQEKKWIKKLALECDLTIQDLVIESIKTYEKIKENTNGKDPWDEQVF